MRSRGDYMATQGVLVLLAVGVSLIKAFEHVLADRVGLVKQVVG